MTVSYVGELAEARTATNSKGIRTYERGFRLTTSARTDNAANVGSNASLPIIGNTHPGDGTAYCTDLRVRCVRGWRIWEVTASYSSERQLSTTPTSDVARITWDSEQFQRVAVEDRNGDGITNSAGEFFDPPASIDDSRRVVTVEKNLAVVPSWILDYQDAVNSDQFTVDGITIAIGCAKMQKVTVGAKEERNGTAFRTVRFTMALQRDGWALKILDAGYTKKKAADPTKREQAILDDGTDPKLPILLDGNGDVLDNPSPANAVFRTFNVYKQRAFSSLPLT